MTDKEIIIDGIKYFRQNDTNKGLDEEHYVTEFHLLATHYNLLLEDYACKYNSLKEQLKCKEQECEHWKSQCLCFDDEYVTVQITQEQFEEYHQNKQALNEIEQTISNFPSKGIQDIPQTQIECTQYFLSISETKLQKILDIINKAKEQ